MRGILFAEALRAENGITDAFCSKKCAGASSFKSTGHVPLLLLNEKQWLDFRLNEQVLSRFHVNCLECLSCTGTYYRTDCVLRTCIKGAAHGWGIHLTSCKRLSSVCVQYLFIMRSVKHQQGWKLLRSCLAFSMQDLTFGCSWVC